MTISKLTPTPRIGVGSDQKLPPEQVAVPETLPGDETGVTVHGCLARLGN